MLHSRHWKRATFDVYFGGCNLSSTARDVLLSHLGDSLPPFPSANRRLNVKEASAYIGFSASNLNKLRVIGGGPLYSKTGTRGKTRHSTKRAHNNGLEPAVHLNDEAAGLSETISTFMPRFIGIFERR